MGVAQAQARRNEICQQLGEWFIARLANGGSMDGPGYGCQIRSADTRSLGHTVCAPAPRVFTRPHRPPHPAQPSYGPRIDPRAVPNHYVAVHPRWRDQLIIFADGTYQRADGDTGRWHIDQNVLVLDWTRWGTAYLTLQPDGSFVGADGFTLRASRRRAEAAFEPTGSYQAVHPRWHDALYVMADGTYRRGRGDTGHWHLVGQTLVLDWDQWGVARLRRQPDGSFRGPDGFTLTPMVERAPRRVYRGADRYRRARGSRFRGARVQRRR